MVKELRIAITLEGRLRVKSQVRKLVLTWPLRGGTGAKSSYTLIEPKRLLLTGFANG